MVASVPELTMRSISIEGNAPWMASRQLDLELAVGAP